MLQVFSSDDLCLLHGYLLRLIEGYFMGNSRMLQEYLYYGSTGASTGFKGALSII